jgi:hypothetical protein
MMKQYDVVCREITEVAYSVEANSAEEAQERVMEGEGDPKTLNAEHQAILNIEEN